MAKSKIVWSHLARIKLFEVLEFYAERNKSKKYSIKLFKRFTKELDFLIKHLDLGKKTEIEDVRGMVVGDYILFYKKIKDKIIIHTLWDCRQSTDNLKKK